MEKAWAVNNSLAHEPSSMPEATQRVVHVLDAKYEKADLQSIVSTNCTHLSLQDQNKLLELLTEYEEIFDVTLGDWNTDPVSLELKEGVKPYHGRLFPVPKIHKEMIIKELNRLCELGVLEFQPASEWASPTFIIPKKDNTVRFISDFREVNKQLVRKPFPLPKISTVLQELQGFTFATALDLNMGFYTIRLDPDASNICTIIFPWGKYSYLRLPMGIAGSPNIFQAKMSELMAALEFVRTYLDDLLCITRASLDDHLDHLRLVLTRLQDAGLRVNAPKSKFCTIETEYLGYILTRTGIKPQPNKVQVILAITPPKQIKDLHRFLGMVQYYRDLCARRSEMLAPLTSLVVKEIALAQTTDATLKKLKKHDKYSTQLVEDTQLLCKDGRMVIPKALQNRAVSWYHHYLQHPGHTRLEATLHSAMYWKGMRRTIRSNVKNCRICQVNKRHKHKYGKLPAKLVITNPWEALCVDLIGPYTLKGKDGTEIDFMCLTMIDPASSWFDIVELLVSTDA
eukprot:CCRYP_008760-RA/>CCRYP_008760-RA protein AED:0.09 eAED:0.26 QI:0/0/0/1/0/0/2/0/511